MSASSPNGEIGYAVFGEWYDAFRAQVLEPALRAAESSLEHELVDLLSDRDLTRIRSISGRVKSKRRTWRKIHLPRYEGQVRTVGDIAASIDDLVGLRVTCINLRDIDMVQTALDALPRVPGSDLWLDPASVRDYVGEPKASGYRGWHVNLGIPLGEGATLNHIVVQDVESTQVHLGRIAVTQGTRSAFRSHSFNLGGTYGRVVYDVRLAGEEASADLSGLYFGQGRQTLDQQITVTHAAPDCTSRQRFRGVLDDQSTGVFNGGIDVRPGADGTDAHQSNDNLLLSVRAEANTQPRLEILADDVTCKHGATVGQLDDNALYYLRTRGINEPEAHRLLIHGFADETVEAVDNEVLRAWITERLGHDDA